MTNFITYSQNLHSSPVSVIDGVYMPWLQKLKKKNEPLLRWCKVSESVNWTITSQD